MLCEAGGVTGVTVMRVSHTHIPRDACFPTHMYITNAFMFYKSYVVIYVLHVIVIYVPPAWVFCFPGPVVGIITDLQLYT